MPPPMYPRDRSGSYTGLRAVDLSFDTLRAYLGFPRHYSQ